MSEGPSAEETAKAIVAEQQAMVGGEKAKEERTLQRFVKQCTAGMLLFVGSCGACGACSYLIDSMELGKWTEPVAIVGGLFCKDHARSQLKAPSTAEFPRFVEAVLVGSQDQPFTEQVWAVLSYVDSQNSFGATIRTSYACILKPPTSQDESWEIVHFQFDE